MSSKLFTDHRVMLLPLEAELTPLPERGDVCCDAMHAALDFSCDQHESPFDCPDALLIYHAIFEEYGLIVHDGGPTYVLISHCPWCGGKLPDSQRDRWFDETEAFENDGKDVPQIYLSDAWRKPKAGS